MHHVGSFSLIDQHGQQVSEAALNDKVTIAHFFFTRCRDVCPLTISALAALLDSLPANPRVQILSYSVTPERDSVAALEDFAREHHLRDPRWHLLTGARATTARLASQSFFVRLGDGRSYGVDSIAHTESLVLVDGHGRLRGFYAGTLPVELNRLIEDIRELLRN
jgi:protein SCO1/2